MRQKRAPSDWGWHGPSEKHQHAVALQRQWRQHPYLTSFWNLISWNLHITPRSSPSQGQKHLSAFQPFLHVHREISLPAILKTSILIITPQPVLGHRPHGGWSQWINLTMALGHKTAIISIFEQGTNCFVALLHEARAVFVANSPMSLTASCLERDKKTSPYSTPLPWTQWACPVPTCSVFLP